VILGMGKDKGRNHTRRSSEEKGEIKELNRQEGEESKAHERRDRGSNQSL